jgi:Uma2 family endonuclease
MKERSKTATLRIPKPNRSGPYSFDDFLVMVPDGEKADLIDGVIYMASPDNTDAGDLNSWLCALMRGFVDARDLGKVYVSRVAYRLGPKDSPEPDLGFLPKDQLSQRERGFIDGPPALAVEIVSPDSVDRDYVKKLKLYRKAGVKEYWIIDLDAPRATFLVLEGKKYKKVAPVKHIYKSVVLPGFDIDVRWLFAKDRPNILEVLPRLLAK